MSRQLEIIFILTIWIIVQSCDNQSCTKNKQDEVSILVMNQSGKNIISLFLKHEKGLINIGQLNNQSQTCISYKSPGENAHTLTAILEGGDTLKSYEYTEGGYSLTEIIVADSIETQYQQSY